MERKGSRGADGVEIYGGGKVNWRDQLSQKLMEKNLIILRLIELKTDGCRKENNTEKDKMT